MNNNNFSPFSFFNFCEGVFFTLVEIFKDFGKQYPNTAQIIQLSFMYFFAVIDLIYSLLSVVYSLGYYSEVLDPVFPLIQAILQSSLFQIFASPEKVFVLSYVVLELMVVKSVFGFSKLVRYNILLLFSGLMVQGLVISYWDLLLHRDLPVSSLKFSFEQSETLFMDKILTALFFLTTFMLFFFYYIILYVTAIKGKIFTRPGLEWLTDSVSFWLKIRTSTMKKRGKDFSDE